ncbi:MAG TPA: sulfotransferase, partial [Acetobacteraceae bacterium]|nr:sulfotransferase [Acetobacteraceae bacterium]
TPGLCPCGSGLRPARCCALQVGSIPPAEATRHLVPLVERAIQAYQQGAKDVAERLCLDVLELAPDRPGALSVLYSIRKEQGRAAAAQALIRRLVHFEPNNFEATNELALLLLGKGALGEAEIHARNAIRIAPQAPQAHNLMGMIMTEAQRPRLGEYHYRKVLEITGTRDPIVLANLAWCLKNQGRMEEARALYVESTATAPDIRETLLGWARLEEADRNFAAAGEILDRLDARFPNDPGSVLTRAVLLGRMKRPDDALALLDRKAPAPEGTTQSGAIGDSLASAPIGLGPTELSEKGRLLDQLDRHDEAWAAFVEGKRLARELTGSAYLDQLAGDAIARLRGFFVSGRLALLPRAGVRSDVPQPVFVLGFPRSGTTLVEQTLSAHPAISAGDELPLINDITNIMPRMLNSPLQYPEALAELWMGDQRDGLDNLRDYYLQKAAQMAVAEPGAAWFTDKMPLNETHLGLIALLFPASPLIHVIRHPLDVMISALSNHFTHGYFCATALESAATHYVRVMDLVMHYRAEMALRYLPVRYDAMVTNQEETVRSILDFIGVPFDERCLSFHENRRYARTASYAQVTEPLYDRSLYRYRNYRQHLEPVIPILRPTIERLGYTVD